LAWDRQNSYGQTDRRNGGNACKREVNFHQKISIGITENLYVVRLSFAPTIVPL
jgi:hypothetical protein